jgi:hypothetical protein
MSIVWLFRFSLNVFKVVWLELSLTAAAMQGFFYLLILLFDGRKIVSPLDFP